MSIIINLRYGPYRNMFHNFYHYVIESGYGYTNKSIQLAFDNEPYKAKLNYGPALLLDCYSIEFESSDDLIFFVLRWS